MTDKRKRSRAKPKTPPAPSDDRRHTLVLVDGNSLLYRAFFALPMLTTSQGEVTNAIYGFTMMLYKVLEEQKPECVAVCFDVPKPTFRHFRYTEYKATRRRTPDELAAQVGMAKDILRAMHIPILEVEGYEADDVIGAVAKRASAQDHAVLIVTGDLDTLQLVSDTNHVTVMTTKRGITDTVTYDEAAVRDRYGLPPTQLPELKALRGDASDNIPGVPGVGEKTASKLVQEFGSVEELLAHLDRVDNPKLADVLRTYADQLAMSKDLAVIRTDFDLDFDIHQCRVGPPDADKLIELFRRFEFKSLLSKLEAPEEGAAVPVQAAIADTSEKVATLARKLLAVERFSLVLVYTAGGGLKGAVMGAAFFAPDAGAHFVPLLTAHPTATFGEGKADHEPGADEPNEELWAALDPVWADEKVPKATHDLKAAYDALCRRRRALRGAQFDTMLASYLLNPARQTHRIADIAFEQLRVTPGDELDLNKAWELGDLTGIAHQVCLWARQIYQLEPVLRQRLDEAYLTELYDTLELPLTRVLSDMELVGVAVDAKHLKRLSADLAQRIAELESRIYELAGEKFTINSPKQLQVILFEKLKLPAGKKTKTGYSTAADVLESLADKHEIVRRILEFREVAKLQSTYVEALPKLIDPATGRVHTTLNQTVTATGRLSSSDPNLQNIPVRGDLGQNIRRAFVAGRPDWVLLAADYSQIELRVLAHISRDESLLNIFAAGEDLHTTTACEIFGVEANAVEPHMRRLAKVVNFGIPYGISEHGLARDMGVSRTEAKDYITRYFGRFPGVRDYVEQVVEEARRTGHVTTILGRRRVLPDLNSSVRQLREFAERTAINTPIQGSAADIIKLAMLAVHRELEMFAAERGYAVDSGGTTRACPTGHPDRPQMILQVHDELLLELPRDDVPAVARLVCKCMTQAYPLAVPLEVEMKAGPNWADMKPFSLSAETGEAIECPAPVAPAEDEPYPHES
jgi:DNA polymerase-1